MLMLCKGEKNLPINSLQIGSVKSGAHELPVGSWAPGKVHQA